MAGILDAFFNPTPEQSKGRLAAASRILEMSGPSRTPVSLMSILGSGMSAYEQGVESHRDQEALQQHRAMQQQLLDWKIKDAEADFGHQQGARERDTRIAKRMAGLMGQGGMSLPPGVGMPGSMPGPQQASLTPEAQQFMNVPALGSSEWMQGIQQQAASPSLDAPFTTDPNSSQFWLQSAMPGRAIASLQAAGPGAPDAKGGASAPNNVDWLSLGLPVDTALHMQQGQRRNRTQEMVGNLMSKAQIQFEEGDAAGAEKTLDLIQKFRPNAIWKEVRRGGKVVNMPFYDDGQPGEASDAEVAAKLHWEDTGPTTMGLDPFDGSVRTQIRNGMSPDGAANNAVARANLGLSRERLELERQAQGSGGKAPAGYRWTQDGSLEAIPGGPATKGATATEGERKAATLLMRMQGSQAQLDEALKDAPGAATPSLLTQGLRGVGAEAAANTATGQNRQRVEAAQLDMLDAALTLGTGAAYTKEQLEGYRRSYFPQIGDAPETVKDKKARLDNVIEAAKIAAGRSAPPKPTITLNDIQATARSSGRSTREVTAAFRAKGYKIQGDK